MPRLVLLLLLAAGVPGAAFDRAKLDAWRDRLAARRTTGLLVLHRGETVYEWYAPGWSATRPHGTASLAKALVGGVTLMLALDGGKLRPEDPAALFIPGWKDSPRKARIQVRHLATHTSGIEDAEQDGLPHEKLPGWKGAFWRREPDPFSIALRDAPALFEPGSANAYSNPGMAALAYVVTRAAGRDLKSLLAGRVMQPLGIPAAEWSIGYGRAYEVDDLQLYANWGGGSFSARAAARIGQAMIERTLARRATHDLATRYAGLPLPRRAAGDPAPGSGLGWYTNFDGVWPAVPRDAIAGAGAGHQVLLAVPSLDLVLVRHGDALEAAGRGAGFWGPVYEELFRPLMDAGGAGLSLPYPPSQRFRGVSFAPPSEVRRAAPGSDNWPVTWGRNGRLYTSYGDGWGFEPRSPRKLSLGLAAIDGGPEGFSGTNLPSDGERLGDGAKGPKASGLVMVDGTLWMWVRNTGNATLWRSGDKARTWSEVFRFEESFGSPSFVQEGRDGGRARYVYSVSQEGPSAYESDNHLVLARAPRRRLAERRAWEFFAGLDQKGAPRWSRDIAARRPVFRAPRRCQRTEMVFHAPSGRYLLALGYDHDGRWGLFEAPAPWGPWAAVFHTEQWDLPGTHGYRLPVKWISGNDLWLVFSGVKENDALCVRKMVLEDFR
jgi:CubicO group peptidase (beta-lactamase class C family)